MSPSSQHVSLAEYYFGLLKHLNTDSKLDLISQLSQSMKEPNASDEVSLKSLFGAYRSEETAEEIIADIRASRVNNRTLESL